jgi:hypothetical protein
LIVENSKQVFNSLSPLGSIISLIAEVGLCELG